MAQYKLYDLATVLRSKNSGPFSLTLDVLFDNEKIYHQIKSSGCINKAIIAKLYQVSPEDIQQLVFYDPALGFKITLARKISSGTCLDTDVYGSQQHAPLMELMIDI